MARKQPRITGQETVKVMPHKEPEQFDSTATVSPESPDVPQRSLAGDSTQRPHVYVMGDLAELQLEVHHSRLPDQADPLLAPYRKLHGFVRRGLRGGAWSLTQFIRAALRDVWHFETELTEARGVIRASYHQGTEGWDILQERDHYSKKDESWIGFASSRVAPNSQGFVEMRYPSREDANKETVILPTPRESASLFEFCKGTFRLELNCGQPVPSDDSALCDITNGSHIERTISASPTYAKIEPAVRFVKQDSFAPGTRPYRLFNTGAWMEKCSALEVWASLTGDVKDSLRTFMFRRQRESSRLVLLIADRKSLKITRPGSPRYRGFLLLPAVPVQWQLASSLADIIAEHPTCAVHTFGSVRLLIDPRPHGEEPLLGFPITDEILRLIPSEQRPLPTIDAPLALISTMEPLPNDQPSLMRLALPIWKMSLHDTKSVGSVLRMERAVGYQWDNQSSIIEAWTVARKRDAELTGKPFDVSPHLTESQLIEALEWGLSHFHKHGSWQPTWAPCKMCMLRPFLHLAVMDLNFGFRRAENEIGVDDDSVDEFETDSPADGQQVLPATSGQPTIQTEDRDVCGETAKPLNASDATSTGKIGGLTQLLRKVLHDPSRHVTATDTSLAATNWFTEAEKQLGILPETPVPDWWHPLKAWAGLNVSSSKPLAPAASPDSRGWIVGVFGRMLPLSEHHSQDPSHAWERGDLWDVLRNAKVRIRANNKPPTPSWLFRERVIVVLSGQLLRATGARISHRLSWEHTALDCVRELEGNPLFRPLLDFPHVIVRLGCSGAVYFHHLVQADNKIIRQPDLFYDATAHNGFHRDPTKDGRVIGNNSVFAARILQQIIADDRNLDPSFDPTSLIKQAIRQSLIDCQELFALGYGPKFREDEGNPIDYRAPLDVLFTTQQK